MSLKIAVIYGSVRENRQGIKAAKFMVNQLKNAGHDVTLIDPLEYKLPFFEKGFAEYNDDAPENLKIISKQLKEADGYIIVTAEYNHNLPPALANLLSHFGKEYEKKPAGIVSYSSGPFGGIRASITVRELLSGIGIVAIPTVFPISNVHQSFDNDGTALDESYIRRSGKFIDEFVWYTSALKYKRDNN
ncbi:NADPH-dependent FMN reductase [Bacteroidota bacterium]